MHKNTSLGCLFFFALIPLYTHTDLCHAQRLKVLKGQGFNPRIIYDIGAYKGEWTQDIKKIFPHAHFFLFEANDCHEKDLKKVECPYFCVLLGNEEKSVIFHARNGTGDSIFLEQTHHYSERKGTQKKLPMVTLETLVKENTLPLPQLIKIDVQGAEKLVLEGAINLLSEAEVIILEIGILEYNKNAPLLHEMITFMHQLGYRALDICELHYLPTQELCEIDILFVKSHSSFIKQGILG